MITDPSARVTVSMPFRLLTRRPSEPSSGPVPLVLALHGYGMDAETMLALAARFTPGDVLLVAAEGPHTALVPGPPNTEPTKAFHWGVSPRAEENRAAHRACVAEAIRWAEAQGGDPARVALVGFSQPCSFDYRLALDPPHGRPFEALVAICGGIPGEWTSNEPGTPASLAARVLHVSTKEDPLYPMKRVAVFRERLAARFGEVTHSFYDGGHRVPSAASAEIRSFLARP
jgi:predicted esterase